MCDKIKQYKIHTFDTHGNEIDLKTVEAWCASEAYLNVKFVLKDHTSYWCEILL